MAEGIKNKKQHYVPRCYLRGFSNNGKGIFTYNKSLERSFQIGIKDACQIDDFYKIHRKFVDEPDYHITTDELQALIEKVTRMQDVVERICRDKIGGLS
jgi:hypothetical protein